jgi:hypothetical protein
LKTEIAHTTATTITARTMMAEVDMTVSLKGILDDGVMAASDR